MFCDGRLEAGQTFCQNCDHPTSWATYDEKVAWEVRQWRKELVGTGSAKHADTHEVAAEQSIATVTRLPGPGAFDRNSFPDPTPIYQPPPRYRSRTALLEASAEDADVPQIIVHEPVVEPVAATIRPTVIATSAIASHHAPLADTWGVRPRRGEPLTPRLIDGARRRFAERRTTRAEARAQAAAERAALASATAAREAQTAALIEAEARAEARRSANDATVSRIHDDEDVVLPASIGEKALILKLVRVMNARIAELEARIAELEAAPVRRRIVGR